MVNTNRSKEGILTAIKKGYTVDDFGNVYFKGNKLKIQKHKSNKTAYYTFGIRLYDTKMIHIKVHRYIAYQKFGDKIFEKGIQIRHLDSNPLNNNLDNIGIGTAKENANDINPNVRVNRSLIATSFIKVHNHEEIIKLRNEGLSYKELMEKFNITSKGTLSFIINKSIQSK